MAQRLPLGPILLQGQHLSPRQTSGASVEEGLRALVWEFGQGLEGAGKSWKERYWKGRKGSH